MPEWVTLITYVLRDLLDPEKIEANLEEVAADKSGEIDMEEWINAARISASRRVESRHQLVSIAR